MIEAERPIDLGYHFPGALVVGSDHDSIRMLEIVDGGAFAEEFGVGYNSHIGIRMNFLNNSLDFVASSNRHRGFRDNDREAIERRCDLTRRVVDVGEIRVSVASPRWCANGNKDHVGGADWFGKLGCERQSTRANIGAQEFRQSGLIDRAFATSKRFNLRSIFVDANNLMAKIGKTGSGNQTHIPSADHCYAHEIFPVTSPCLLTNMKM